MDELIKKCREVKENHPIQVVIVDALDFRTGFLQSVFWRDITFLRREKLTEAFHGLKQMASELGIVILLNINISPNAERRYHNFPEPQDFMLPAEVMDEADGVLALYRDSYYFTDLSEEEKNMMRVFVFRSREAEKREAVLKWNLDPGNLQISDCDIIPHQLTDWGF